MLALWDDGHLLWACLILSHRCLAGWFMKHSATKLLFWPTAKSRGCEMERGDKFSLQRCHIVSLRSIAAGFVEAAGELRHAVCVRFVCSYFMCLKESTVEAHTLMGLIRLGRIQHPLLQLLCIPYRYHSCNANQLTARNFSHFYENIIQCSMWVIMRLFKTLFAVATKISHACTVTLTAP